jgi:hypothetical protein
MKALNWLAKLFMTPEVERLIKQISDEDLKDLLALHGAGSFDRQCNAKLKNELSQPLMGFFCSPFVSLYKWVMTTPLADKDPGV